MHTISWLAGWLCLSAPMPMAMPMPLPEERSTGARFNGLGSGASGVEGEEEAAGAEEEGGVDGGRFPCGMGRGLPPPRWKWPWFLGIPMLLFLKKYSSYSFLELIKLHAKCYKH
jgi:hypothetical protein